MARPAALLELERARRAHFAQHTDFVTAIYRAYLAASVSAIVLSVVVSYSSQLRLSLGERNQFVTHAPMVGAVFYLVSVIAGLGSGLGGGPIGIAEAEARLVLLSPLPRASYLRAKLIKRFRHLTFAALVVGGVFGASISKGFSEPLIYFGGAFAGFAVTVVFAYLGIAGAVSGLGVPNWAVRLAQAVVVTVGLIVVLAEPSNLLTMALGGVLVLALQGSKELASILFAPMLSILFGCLGMFYIVGVDTEKVMRRARLVGLMVYAATFRDIRAVIILRRALSSERFVLRNRVTEAMMSIFGTRRPSLVRSLLPIARFPITRYLRIMILSITVALSARSAVSGAYFYLAISSIALWLFGLELIEAISQTTDVPQILTGAPLNPGDLERRLLVGPILAGLVLGLPGLVALAFTPRGAVSVELGLIIYLPAIISGVVGAAIGTLRERKEDAVAPLAPEVTQIATLALEIFPILLAGLGLIPVFQIHSAFLSHQLVFEAAISSAAFSLVFPLGGAAWIARRGMYK